MDTKDNGGPAFPHHFTEDSVGDCVGMTLRDYFAAKAMQAMIANDWALHTGEAKQSVAYHAYSVADAMLEARKQ